VKKALFPDLFILIITVILSCEKENQPPKCNIITPYDNTIFYRGDTVNISIEASDLDGTIAEIRLYIN